MRIRRRLTQINKTPKLNLPQIYTSFEVSEHINRSGGRIFPIFTVKFKNEGNKTAKKFNNHILIGSDNKIEIQQNMRGGISDISRLDSITYDLETFLEENQSIQAFEFIFPENRTVIDEIHPSTQISHGYLAIYEKDIDKIKQIIVINIDDNGFIRQEFKVSSENEVKALEETKREFHTYK